jgi:membrane fusion protein, copper/silver efflux system
MKYRNMILGMIGMALVSAIAGCNGDASSHAATVVPEQTFPRLVQDNGQEYFLLNQTETSGAQSVLVREVPLPRTLETTGQVTFDDRRVSTITSRVQGRIEDIKVSLWDTVRKGQPIIEVYSPDFMLGQAEYLQAKTTSKVSANSSIEGTADLAASMVSAVKRKLELLGMSDADIDAIRSPAPVIWMRAPISGTVVQNQSVIGSAINPGDVLYQLGTLDHVWITADVYEVDLARVRVGQELEAVTTTFPDEVFKGVISRISPNIDPNAHTAEIRCEVDNPTLKLKPQMLARVKIITQPGSALVVPQKALVFDGDTYCAFVEVATGKFQRRKVEIGSWNEQGYARILSGLSAGDRVTGESLKLNALWHAARGESY